MSSQTASVSWWNESARALALNCTKRKQARGGQPGTYLNPALLLIATALIWTGPILTTLMMMLISLTAIHKQQVEYIPTQASRLYHGLCFIHLPSKMALAYIRNTWGKLR